jgi:hypothetical protein
MVMGTINSIIGAFLSVESTFRYAVIVDSIYMGIFTEVTLPTPHTGSQICIAAA